MPVATSERNQISPHYVDFRSDYDGSFGPEINLGLASSPLGPAPELAEVLTGYDPLRGLAEYHKDPRHQEIKQLLINALKLKGINTDCVEFNGNGSYGAGDEIFRMLARRGYQGVLVPNYSFPNTAEWAQRHGLDYQPLLTDSLDPLISITQILTIKSELNRKIVYLDYPNNPFGQGDSSLTREVVRHAVYYGAVPVIDLAFAEVFGREEFVQIIQYTLDSGGICLASLSKTQGLPNLRTGWAFVSPTLVNDFYHGNERLVFGLNHQAQLLLRVLFSPDEENGDLAQRHAQRVADYNVQTNIKLISALNDLGLWVGPTQLRTPIQVVIAPEDCPDFYQRLLRVGIITESMTGYQATLGNTNGYGDRAVRMLTPRPGTLSEVINRIKQAIDF